MWCCLTRFAEARVLDLGEVADLRARADVAARAEVAVRPDRHAVLDRRALDDAQPDAAAARRSSSPSIVVPGPMVEPSPIRVAPRRTTPGSRVTSCAELDRPVDVHRRRVAHRHAGAHVRLVDPDAERPLGLGELAPVVDAVERAVVLEADGAHDPAVLAGELDEIGEVQLAVRGRRREGVDPPAEPGARRTRTRRR